MSPAIGYGCTLTWATNVVGRLTSIGGVNLTAAKVDATTFASVDSYKEVLPGMLDPGEVPIEGYFDPDDTLGQVALMTSFNARTIGAWTITFPTEISTAAWAGNAYVIGLAIGALTLEGMIPFTAVLAITGKPVLSITASGGMTAFAGIEENAGAALDLVPNFLAGILTYTATVNTASTWVKLTVTAAAHTITVTVLGVTHTLVTAVQSDALVIGAANTVTELVITCKETGKVAKVYSLFVSRP
jgi:hypothetical protein